MKTKFIAQILLLSLIFITYSSLKAGEEIKKAPKGTYQIQFKPGKDQTPVSLTDELLEKIENSRSESKIVFITPEDNYQIMILPYNTINDLNFKPIIDYIIID